MDMFNATPDPAPDGWGAPLPTRIDVAGGEVRLSLEGTDFTVRAGETARIGRAPDNDLVTVAPTVSRHHAVLG
ncbi:MAG TPA: FHA domain-containing protein, partial [Trebonia sp.]|nr:FHA domain-containing protein [Trebonia sp.]